MPSNKGTSRKGKPKKNERAAGMGQALKNAHTKAFKPKDNGAGSGAGMQRTNEAAERAGDLNRADESHKKMLSVLEVDSLEDFIQSAEMADRQYEAERERFLVLDDVGQQYRSYDGPQRMQMLPATEVDSFGGATGASAPTGGTDFSFANLSIPRRPAWDESTTKEDLDRLEKESFLGWRRDVAALEERHGAGSVTPFEKNIEVWRQLWRVLERSSVVCQVVDARNPLFYITADLRKYAEEELGKPMLVVVNKSDYLTAGQRTLWHKYLSDMGIYHVFFSAHAEQNKLDDKARAERDAVENSGADVVDEALFFEESSEEEGGEDSGDDDANYEDLPDDEQDPEELDPSKPPPRPESDKFGVENLLVRQELLDFFEAFAAEHGCARNPRYLDKVQYGMVGFPNVGKSSLINVLIGASKFAHGSARAAVAAQPGKTKHFQTLLIHDRDAMLLCDCPGLVFPSLVSSTADLIAAGVYPIAQMRDHWPVVGLICRRIPREILNAFYGFRLPVAKPVGFIRGEDKERDEAFDKAAASKPPTAEELLTTYCLARSVLSAGSGLPDHQRASRVVVTDYVLGRLLYCHPPPTIEDGSPLDKLFRRESAITCMLHCEKLKTQIEGKLQAVREQSGYKYSEEMLAAAKAGEAEQQAGATEAESEIDILALIGGGKGGGGGDEDEEEQNGGKRGKAHKSRPKRAGKKDKSNRDPDPYGCHKDGAKAVLEGSRHDSGVHVSAGKFSAGNYARPNFAGGKSIGLSGGTVRRPETGGDRREERSILDDME